MVCIPDVFESVLTDIGDTTTAEQIRSEVEARTEAF